MKKKDKEVLDKANNKISNNFNWLMEFSKKVVFWCFIIYIVSSIFIMILLYLNHLNGETVGFELFISETNTTFKLVVGSYVLKAMFENIIKIGGSKYKDLVEIKNRLYKDVISKETGVDLSDVKMDNNDISNNDNVEEDNQNYG